MNRGCRPLAPASPPRRPPSTEEVVLVDSPEYQGRQGPCTPPLPASPPPPPASPPPSRLPTVLREDGVLEIPAPPHLSLLPLLPPQPKGLRLAPNIFR